MLEEYLIVGEIARPQGLHGELKIKPYTDNPDRFFDLKTVRINGAALKLHTLRVRDGFVYARLEGVYSREAAEAGRGALLYIARADAVPLPEDTEFICDLIGCEASDTDGRPRGRLTEVLQPGGADVYVLNGPDGRMMIPAIRKVVLKVDVRAKTMLLDAQGIRETAVFD